MVRFFVICPAARPLVSHPEGKSAQQLEVGVNERQSGLREVPTAGVFDYHRIPVAQWGQIRQTLRQDLAG